MLQRLECMNVVFVLICVINHINSQKTGVEVFKSPNPPQTPDEKIIGGGEVLPHSVPHMVALKVRFPFGRVGFCGGSLISDRHILTAAHCVRNAVSVSEVKLGAHNRWIKEPEQVIRYRATYDIHEDHDASKASHDLALITLLNPVDLSSPHIQPAKLPDDRDAEKSYVDELVQAYGWGWVEDFPIVRPKHLMGVDLTVISHKDCVADAFPYKPKLHEYDICTSGKGRIGGCHGDSGGPLMHNGVLIGVVSRGTGRSCTEGYSTVFVSVAHHLDWIKEKMNE